VDPNLTDNQSHRVSLYLLDWDNAGRSERIDVLDANTGVVLDSRTVSSFSSGQYLTWNLRGHVQIRITRLAGPTAVLSGVYFSVNACCDPGMGRPPMQRRPHSTRILTGEFFTRPHRLNCATEVFHRMSCHASRA
jgi:hypothetical protein